MATVITMSIPDAVAVRVRDGYAARHGYKEFIEGPTGDRIENPETKLQFVKRHLKEYVRDSVIAYEAEKSALLAKGTAEADVVNINITVS